MSFQSETLAASFFDRQAATWADRYQSASYKQRRQLIGEIIRKEVLRRNWPTSTIKLLDFGCGSGMLLNDAADLALQVTGVDNSKVMIGAARDQLASFGAQVKLEWLQSSSGEGNYEAQNYDIVLCLSVLEFVPDMRVLLSRLSARVATGGMLALSVPNRRSWLRSIEGFIHRYPRVFRRFAALEHLTGVDSYLNYQVHQFTHKDLSRIAQNYGLREESHRFHVAPSWLRRVERHENVGMMLIATFRKD